MNEQTDLEWRKSSDSATSSECVQVALDGTDRLVRDSKDPNGPLLRFTSAEWKAWLVGVKAGEFD
jgi:hypothetical protein